MAAEYVATLLGDSIILRFTTCHENALSPRGGEGARDRAFTSRRGSEEGILVLRPSLFRWLAGYRPSRPCPTSILAMAGNSLLFRNLLMLRWLHLGLMDIGLPDRCMDEMLGVCCLQH